MRPCFYPPICFRWARTGTRCEARRSKERWAANRQEATVTAQAVAVRLSPMSERHAGGTPDRAWLRHLVIGTTAFLTVVDLFATQAILPMLAASYRVTPAAMGLAVNACTVGMAVASLAVSAFSSRVDRRWAILLSLILLALPTSLLALRPALPLFAALRVTQGLCMATAFTLTLAYLGEQCSAREAAGAFAAYVTGNVASNLVGRLVAAGVAGHFGLPTTFL